MALARLIVCETTSQWVVALRRQLPREFWPRICETRSLHDCWQLTVANPNSLVVLEVTHANLEQLAAELPKYRAVVPRVPVVVMGSRRLATAEWLLRELGSVHAVFSTRAMGPVVRIVQRHWGRIEEPAESGNPWRQLPWGADAERVGGGNAGGPQHRGEPIAEPDWLIGDGS